MLRQASLPNSETVSVIICTNGRPLSLAKTIDALKHQCFRNFEICVVCGPHQNGVQEISQIGCDIGRVKIASCDQENISMARNIGLRLAAGSLVAFIDDDALAEPVWLRDLLRSFTSPNIAGASGMVFEPSGRQHQFRFALCNRLGVSDHGISQPGDAAGFPFSSRFPYTAGTNCMFRRSALVTAGGFDEEFDHHLEMEDLCSRLIDTGHAIRQMSAGPVHHKLVASVMRDRSRAWIKHRSAIKARIYFALANGPLYASMSEIIASALRFVEERRAYVVERIRAGALEASTLDAFEAEADQAWTEGLTRGLSGVRRLQAAQTFAAPPPFLPFLSPTHRVINRRHVAMVLPNRDAHPTAYIEALTVAQSRCGTDEFVRAISLCGAPEYEAEGVDIVDGLWLQRVRPQSTVARSAPAELQITPEAWMRAVEIWQAIEEIDKFDRIDVIEDWSNDTITTAGVRSGDMRIKAKA